MDVEEIDEAQDSRKQVLTWFRSLAETLMDESTWPVIQRWIDREDGVAIYENQDFSHSMLGHRKAVSYGSANAQIEVRTAEELPIKLPDFTDSINWRYRLIGVFRPTEQPEEIEDYG